MSRSVIAVAAALLALPAMAQAATPRPKALLEAHRHNTGGHDWHVQVEVNKSSSSLVTIVVYSQLCGETGFTQKSPIAKDGSFQLTDVPFPDNQGTWSAQGTFTDPDHATGSWSVTKGDCVDGGDFKLQDASGHFLIGNPYEYAPEKINGDSLAARRLRKIKYETGQNAHRFDTIAKARKQGYELSTATGCPGMHHARKHGTSFWGKLLDASAPQSLVYWCDSQKHWTLAAFMYRADGKTRPNTFGRMIQWHKHGPTASWMMHVWLVADPINAFATCAPFPAFAAAGMFTYEPYLIDAHVDNPCSDSAPPGELQTTTSTGGA
jgi:hypothetical protein